MYALVADMDSMSLILIGGLFLVLCIVIFLAMRRKESKKIEGEEPKAIGQEELVKVEPEKYNEKKEELSLSEIKASKSMKVADSRSKEEMRQLRQERRAKEQTEASKEKLSQDNEKRESSESSKVVFASLFGEVGDGLSLDLDSFGKEEIEKPESKGAVIPTLGSGLLNIQPMSENEDKKKD